MPSLLFICLGTCATCLHFVRLDQVNHSSKIAHKVWALALAGSLPVLLAKSRCLAFVRANTSRLAKEGRYIARRQRSKFGLQGLSMNWQPQAARTIWFTF